MTDAEQVLETMKDLAGREERIRRAAIRLCLAVEAGDVALVEDHIRDAAAGFRAVIEENC